MRPVRHVRSLPCCRAFYSDPAPDDPTAADALGDFHDFPAWPWRNTEIVRFVDWLRSHNGTRGTGVRKVGFHGLLVEDAVAEGPIRTEADALNALARHLADRLAMLLQDMETGGQNARLVVWAHNLHVGDARATEMGQHGTVSLGQLVRERHGDAAMLVGFTTDHGTVTATTDWGQPPERRRVRPARLSSYEALFHRTEVARFLFPCRRPTGSPSACAGPGRSALGAVYHPDAESGHYFSAKLLEQFDAVLHEDATTAVEPLDPGTAWHAQAA